MLRQFTRLSSPVAAFVEDCCRVAEGASVETDVIWKAWEKWSKEAGHEAGSKDRFGERLRSAVPTITRTRPRVAGERIYKYEGVELDQTGEAP
jgi:phage/plasmid-associated DNA primase